MQCKTDIPLYPCEIVGCSAYAWQCEPMPYHQAYWYQHQPSFQAPPPGLLSHGAIYPEDSPMKKRIGNKKLHKQRLATPCAEPSTSEPAAEPDVVVCV